MTARSEQRPQLLYSASGTAAAASGPPLKPDKEGVASPLGEAGSALSISAAPAPGGGDEAEALGSPTAWADVEAKAASVAASPVTNAVTPTSTAPPVAAPPVVDSSSPSRLSEVPTAPPPQLHFHEEAEQKKDGSAEKSDEVTVTRRVCRTHVHVHVAVHVRVRVCACVHVRV